MRARPPGVVSGLPNMTPIFSRSWLVKMSAVFEPRDRAGQLAQGLAHEPGLDAHEAVAHLALDLGARHERGDRVDDDAVDAARADERLGDLERLLAGVGLADEELVDVDAAGPGVARIEGVLDVDEGGDAAARLGLGEDVLADGGLARRLGPKISVIRPRGMPPTPSARSSAIEPVGIVSSTCRSPEPSFMIEPRPNCFSMSRGAASTALPRSRRRSLRRSALPSSPSIRHAPHPTRGPSAERTRWASAWSISLRRCRPRRRGVPCAASGSPRRSAAAPTAATASVRALGLRLLLGFVVRSVSGAHRLRLRVVLQTYRMTLHADFTAPSLPLSRPARRRSSEIAAGKRSGLDRGSDPGHEV